MFGVFLYIRESFHDHAFSQMLLGVYIFNFILFIYRSGHIWNISPVFAFFQVHKKKERQKEQNEQNL